MSKIKMSVSELIDKLNEYNKEQTTNVLRVDVSTNGTILCVPDC